MIAIPAGGVPALPHAAAGGGLRLQGTGTPAAVSGVHKGGFSKGGFSNLCVMIIIISSSSSIMFVLLNPPLLNTPLLCELPTVVMQSLSQIITSAFHLDLCCWASVQASSPRGAEDRAGPQAAAERAEGLLQTLVPAGCALAIY